jgi:glycerophosphoryl diester phosphodiesterase
MMDQVSEPTSGTGRACGTAPAAAHRPPVPARRPLISAHQGGGEDARPASYAAFEQSVTTGAEYVEFDIRRTRDRALVVFHDERAGGQPVAGLRYAELCAAAGDRVPLVADVLSLLAGRAQGHLDLKETGYEADVITLAATILGADNFVATTLEDESVAVIKRAFPEVRAALSLGRDLRGVAAARWLGVRASELFPLTRVRACGADWVAANYQLARAGVTAACHRAGIGVMVWTVDSGRLIDTFLADDRVEVLITNRPRHAAARRALARRG